MQRLVRRPTSSPGEVSWDPAGARLDPRALEGADAVVNLAGAGVGDHRLTPEYKEIVRTLAHDHDRAARAHHRRGSAAGRRCCSTRPGIGAYGERGDDVLDETSPLGDTFFAGVVRDWEAATAPAAEAGARVVLLRTGIVLTPAGGALERLLPIVRAGVGGRLGSGDQFWSWITLPDEIAAMVHLLQRRRRERAGQPHRAAPGDERRRHPRAGARRCTVPRGCRCPRPRSSSCSATSRARSSGPSGRCPRCSARAASSGSTGRSARPPTGSRAS